MDHNFLQAGLNSLKTEFCSNAQQWENLQRLGVFKQFKMFIIDVLKHARVVISLMQGRLISLSLKEKRF